MWQTNTMKSILLYIPKYRHESWESIQSLVNSESQIIGVQPVTVITWRLPVNKPPRDSLIYTPDLSRLGFSTGDIVTFIANSLKNGSEIFIGTWKIDKTEGGVGHFLIELDETRKNIKSTKIKETLYSQKAAGKAIGRKALPAIIRKKVLELRLQNYSLREIEKTLRSNQLEISKSSIANILNSNTGEEK